jgi:hypothetical protein
MKTIYKIFFLLFFCAGIFSCRTEQQKLISQIDGRWELFDIYLTGSAAEDLPLPESGTITFNKCKIGKNNIQSCEGSHQFNGGSATVFKYQPGNTGEELDAFNIFQFGSREEKDIFLEGHYRITSLGKDEITFEGPIYFVDAEGERESISVTFIFEKK